MIILDEPELDGPIILFLLMQKRQYYLYFYFFIIMELTYKEKYQIAKKEYLDIKRGGMVKAAKFYFTLPSFAVACATPMTAVAFLMKNQDFTIELLKRMAKEILKKVQNQIANMENEIKTQQNGAQITKEEIEKAVIQKIFATFINGIVEGLMNDLAGIKPAKKNTHASFDSSAILKKIVPEISKKVTGMLVVKIDDKYIEQFRQLFSIIKGIKI